MREELVDVPDLQAIIPFPTHFNQIGMMDPRVHTVTTGVFSFKGSNSDPHRSASSSGGVSLFNRDGRQLGDVSASSSSSTSEYDDGTPMNGNGVYNAVRNSDSLVTGIGYVSISEPTLFRL